MPDVRASLESLNFTEQVRSGQWLGYTGKRIRDVVNIGIGGSDLGPSMVWRALLDYQHPDLSVHFISNVDGRHLKKVLKGLDPETTLFVVSTKTFSTQETLLNANSAKRWFQEQTQSTTADMGQHFVAVSTNIEAATAFGIREDSIFEFWDWVGGRYSLWSSIGLPIALSIGYDAFIELLDGAFTMDQHFLNAPLETNMPVLLALIGIWNINFLGAETRRSFLTIRPCTNCRHSCSSWIWRVMASPWTLMATRSATPPVPSCGGKPAPTASMPFSSYCTRAPGSFPSTLLRH